MLFNVNASTAVTILQNGDISRLALRFRNTKNVAGQQRAGQFRIIIAPDCRYLTLIQSREPTVSMTS